ncbi:MAG: 5'/3'-nucleotidase SurE [Myxococcales bacterium]
MRLLLTNDDGIDAIGLKLLAEVCQGLPQTSQVSVVAPLEEQSGVGHRVHTRGGLRWEDRGAGRFALGGTPADCTRVALRGLGLSSDWVISGLNHGGNLGVDIHMSGTVAGAREGAILGLQGIAISQVLNMKHPPDLVRMRATTRRVLEHLFARPLPSGQFYNVNLPFAPESDEPEMVVCTPDPSPHDVRFKESAGEFSYCGVFLNRPRVPDCDVEVVFAGKIAISVLRIV